VRSVVFTWGAVPVGVPLASCPTLELRSAFAFTDDAFRALVVILRWSDVGADVLALAICLSLADPGTSTIRTNARYLLFSVAALLVLGKPRVTNSAVVEHPARVDAFLVRDFVRRAPVLTHQALGVLG
jgi:hypothetical protein